MTPVTLHFEMTDAVMKQALREDCIGQLRDGLPARSLIWVVVSSLIFAMAIASDGHWLWWLSAIPVVLLLGILLVFAGLYVWAPLAGCAKLAHLPHRHVDIEATEDVIAFRTATETLAVAWSEIQSIKRRPNYWVFCLRAGARIPVPLAVVPESLVTEWQTEYGKASKQPTPPPSPPSGTNPA